MLLLQVKPTRRAGRAHFFLLYLIFSLPRYVHHLSFASHSTKKQSVIYPTLSAPGTGRDTPKWDRTKASGDKCRWHSLCQHSVKHGGCQRLSTRSEVGGKGWQCPDVAGHDMHPTVVLLSGQASHFTHDKSITGHVHISELHIVYLESSLRNRQCNYTNLYRSMCHSTNQWQYSECHQISAQYSYLNESNELALCATRPLREKSWSKGTHSNKFSILDSEDTGRRTTKKK